MSGTIRTAIVDKNGKTTHVHKSAISKETNTRSKGLGVPPKSTGTNKLGLRVGKPNTETGLTIPESYVDESYGIPNVFTPTKRSETIALLKDPTGKQSQGEVRWIELDSASVDVSRVRNNDWRAEYDKPYSERKETFNIVPPNDGTPVIVRVRSGIPHLNIENGNAVVVLNSGWGNVLRVAGNANVTVLLGAGKKCTITAEENSTITIIPDVGSRGLLQASDDVNLDIVDWVASEDQHSFTDISKPIDYEARDKANAEQKGANEEALQNWIQSKKEEK